MFCKKCGTEMKDGAMFCPLCGEAANRAAAAPNAVRDKPSRKGVARYAFAACFAALIIAAACFGIFSVSGGSRESEIEWQKSPGASETDEANSVQQTSDGGYIVAGESISTYGDTTGNPTDDFLTVFVLVHDLFELKTGALRYFGDYIRWPDAGSPVSGELVEELVQYMDTGLNAQYLGGVYITPPINIDGEESLYIGVSLEKGAKINRRRGDIESRGYKVGDSFDKNMEGIKKNLASKAKDNGYYQVSGAEVAPYRDASVVYMRMY
jgi:hypothetical protein